MLPFRVPNAFHLNYFVYLAIEKYDNDLMIQYVVHLPVKYLKNFNEIGDTFIHRSHFQYLYTLYISTSEHI